MGMNLEEERFVEECSELVEVLAQMQFLVIKRPDKWKKDFRELKQRFEEEVGDVERAYKRVKACSL